MATRPYDAETEFMAGGKKNGERTTWGWNIHPGEILREEFLKPIGLSVYQLASRFISHAHPSTTLCENGERSRLTPPCGWQGSLARTRSSG